MSTCLALMTNAPTAASALAVASAAHLVQCAVIAIAPGDRAAVPPSPIPNTRVVETPWQGYAATRLATLKAVEEDPSVEWVLMLDAHSQIRGTLPPALENAGIDAYDITIEDVGSKWRWLRGGHLFRARHGFYWKGMGEQGLHEVFYASNGRVTTISPWRRLILSGQASPKVSGAQRNYLQDAHALKLVLKAEPKNARAAFYYAQSLKDAGLYRRAFAAFEHRSEMGGDLEECFWAKLWCSRLSRALGLPQRAIQWAFEAHFDFTERAEPLCEAAEAYRQMGADGLAARMAQRAYQRPYPVYARSFIDVLAYSRKALRDAGVE